MKKIILLSAFILLATLLFAQHVIYTKSTAQAKSQKKSGAIEKTTEPEISQIPDKPAEPLIPDEILCFINAYPNAIFKTEYDTSLADWKINITSMEKTTELYWCEGRLLPKSEIPNKQNYRKNLWKYPEKISDPTTMTKEEIEGFKNFGSDKNRSSGAITAPYFFDAIYDSETQPQTEKHIVTMKLFGQTARVHELIKPVLEEINEEINSLSKTDKEISYFISSLTYADSYFWRKIRDTNGKSFHSFGIAVDVLPKNLRGKSIYWAWEKEFNPDGWMILPLSKRWMPPQKVIDIFENHGFVWGGKWAVWDNMHFEYHPELFEFRKMK